MKKVDSKSKLEKLAGTRRDGVVSHIFVTCKMCTLLNYYILGGISGMQKMKEIQAKRLEQDERRKEAIEQERKRKEAERARKKEIELEEVRQLREEKNKQEQN